MKFKMLIHLVLVQSSAILKNSHECVGGFKGDFCFCLQWIHIFRI